MKSATLNSREVKRIEEFFRTTVKQSSYYSDSPSHRYFTINCWDVEEGSPFLSYSSSNEEKEKNPEIWYYGNDPNIIDDDSQWIGDESEWHLTMEGERKLHQTMKSLFVPGYWNVHCNSEILVFDNEDNLKKYLSIGKYPLQVVSPMGVTYDVERSTRVDFVHSNMKLSKKRTDYLISGLKFTGTALMSWVQMKPHSAVASFEKAKDNFKNLLP